MGNTARVGASWASISLCLDEKDYARARVEGVRGARPSVATLETPEFCAVMMRALFEVPRG
jgi:hypothetical protein